MTAWDPQQFMQAPWTADTWAQSPWAPLVAEIVRLRTVPTPSGAGAPLLAWDATYWRGPVAAGGRVGRPLLGRAVLGRAVLGDGLDGGSPARRRQPARGGAVFVAAVGAAGTAAFVAARDPGRRTRRRRRSPPPSPSPSPSWLTDLFAFELPHGSELERFGLTDAVWVAGIVLAPEGAPTVGAVAGAVAWQVIRRVPAPKLIFNAGQVALASTAAEAVWRLPAEPPAADSPQAWAARRRSGRDGVRDQPDHGRHGRRHVPAAVAALDPAPEPPGGDAPVARRLLGRPAGRARLAGPSRRARAGRPPLLLVYLAHRAFMAGLAEREQMQDLAVTAEQIARDRDLSARLPMDGQSGRLRELTASLNRMLVQLEHASGRERRLMRSAVERLQAPLRTIAFELDDDEPLDDRTRARVLGQARRLTDVLEEMELVALACRPGAVHPAPVAVAPFLRRVADHAEPSLGQRLTLVTPDEDAVARLDPRWVERALLQLLENAAAHGHDRSRVECAACRPAGAGASRSATRAAACRSASRRRSSSPSTALPDSPGRVGLGLALVSGVAEAHGGLGGDHQPAAGRCDVLAPGAGVTVLRPLLPPETPAPDDGTAQDAAVPAPPAGADEQSARLGVQPPRHARPVRALELRRRARARHHRDVRLQPRRHATRRSTTRARDGRAGALDDRGRDHRRHREPRSRSAPRLDQVIRERVVYGPTVRVKVWTPEGRILYSDAKGLIGERYSLRPDLRAALRDGTTHAEVTEHSRPENRFERGKGKLVEVYMPHTTKGGKRVVIETYRRAGSIDAESRNLLGAFLPIVLALLVALGLAQLPIGLFLARRVRRQERDRQQITRRTDAALEAERLRIAADLHDGVVQDLAGTAYELQAVGDRLPADPLAEPGGDLRATLLRGAQACRDSVRALRVLLFELHPSEGAAARARGRARRPGAAAAQPRPATST